MLLWGIQKGLIVTCKSSSLTHFVLSDEEMTVLDGLTTEDDVTKRTELEKERKLQM
jgi:hypothetical protein